MDFDGFTVSAIVVMMAFLIGIGIGSGGSRDH